MLCVFGAQRKWKIRPILFLLALPSWCQPGYFIASWVSQHLLYMSVIYMQVYCWSGCINIDVFESLTVKTRYLLLFYYVQLLFWICFAFQSAAFPENVDHVSPLSCQLALYIVLRHDASHIASRSSDSFIAWRYNWTESLTWSTISPRCGSSPHLTSLSCLLHLSSPVSFIASIHLSLLDSPRSHLCREMAARESHFCLSSLPTFRIPPPLLLLLPTKSLLADDGESEIGRQKEIDFCLPPSQTLLTLTITITITIPPLLLSPLQISAGRLQQDRER